MIKISRNTHKSHEGGVKPFNFSIKNFLSSSFLSKGAAYFFVFKAVKGAVYERRNKTNY